METKHEKDNHSNQLNSNNEAYHKSRGHSRDDDDDDDDDDYVKTDDDEELGDPWPWYSES